MTIKEITALRKSGNLEEAMTAAESEFARGQNKYTASTLFWCLNDLSKRQAGTALQPTMERMQQLYDALCIGDEYMRKALSSVQGRLLPYSSEIIKAISEAKAGVNPLKIYEEIHQAYKDNSLDQSLYPDFGWLIYYALKHVSLNDALKRKMLLHQYLQLNLPRPSILHSRILGEAIKVEQNTPLQFRIRDFMRLWGFENLMEEDWAQFVTDAGHPLPSLVEKLIGVYAKELQTDRIVSPEDFAELVERAVERFPKNQNMLYFRAVVLLSQNKNEQAIECLKQLILKFPSKFYLWSKLAGLVDDVDTRIGMLSKALHCGDEESFLGSVRLELAKMLISKGLRSNAAYELYRYKQTYDEHGWNVKSDYTILLHYVAQVQMVENNEDLYRQYIPFAEDYIYTSLPSIKAVKIADKVADDKHRPGKKYSLWLLRTSKGVLRLKKPANFGLGKFKNGSKFDIRLHEGKIVWIKSTQAVSFSADWLKTVSGVARFRKDRNGKYYVIIDGVYIEARLLKGVAEGNRVKVEAVRQEDGRWSAITLSKLS